jgi:hypothetical protein
LVSQLSAVACRLCHLKLEMQRRTNRCRSWLTAVDVRPGSIPSNRLTRSRLSPDLASARVRLCPNVVSGHLWWYAAWQCISISTTNYAL